MSKRKGLSIDEKKTRMMQIFYESRDFFQLKELEKIAPKEKGIVMQSVKEVVQALVDDHLVDTEKIGTSIYFWAFPSKAKHTRKRKLDQVRNDHNECLKKIAKTTEAIAQAKKDRIDTEERRELLADLKKSTGLEATLKKELEKYKETDPEFMVQLQEETAELKSAINRWTENIFTLKSFCKNKFSTQEAVLNQSFGIPAELDYIYEE